MFKIGQKLNNSNCNCTCNCNCHQQNVKQQNPIKSQINEVKDTFEKSDKSALKTALPYGIAAGVASAGLVFATNALINKVCHTKNGLVTAIATGVGLGVAKGVICGKLANMATEKANQSQNQ